MSDMETYHQLTSAGAGHRGAQSAETSWRGGLCRTWHESGLQPKLSRNYNSFGEFRAVPLTTIRSKLARPGAPQNQDSQLSSRHSRSWFTAHFYGQLTSPPEVAVRALLGNGYHVFDRANLHFHPSLERNRTIFNRPANSAHLFRKSRPQNSFRNQPSQARAII